MKKHVYATLAREEPTSLFALSLPVLEAKTDIGIMDNTMTKTKNKLVTLVNLFFLLIYS